MEVDMQPSSHDHDSVAISTDSQELFTPAHALADFLNGFINLKSMPRPLRYLSLVGFGLFFLMASVIALYNQPQPYTDTGIDIKGQTTVISVIALVILTLTMGLGMTYALAGAMQFRWLPRLITVALITFLLEGSFIIQPGIVSTWTPIEWIQGAVVAAMWIWAFGISLMRFRHRHQSAMINDAGTGRRYLAFFLVALSFLVVFYGLRIGAWLFERTHPSGGNNFTTTIDQLFVINLLLPLTMFAVVVALFVYWFSTDSIELATTIASGIIGKTRLPSSIVLTITGLTAVAAVVLAGFIGLYRAPLLPILTVIVIIGFAGLVVRVGIRTSQWPDEIAPAVLLAGVLTLFGIVDIPNSIPGVLGLWGVITPPMLVPLQGILTILAVLVGLVTALLLSMLGRLRGNGQLTASGLMIALVTLITAVANVASVQQELRVSFLPEPAYLLNAFEVVLAGYILILLISLTLRRMPLASSKEAIAGPFIALIGLEAIDWYTTYLRKASGPSGVLVIAAFFLLSTLWDVSRSGKQMTNGDSPIAPRSGRVLLYFGYALVAAALLLFGVVLRYRHAGGVVPSYFTGGQSVLLVEAISTLGTSLALMTGFNRYQRYQAALLREEHPVNAGLARVAMAGVFGIGLALVILVTGITLPRLNQYSSVTYFTHRPGLDCDTQGASWTNVLPKLLACANDGLHVTVTPDALANGIDFTPPNGVPSKNYRVSVHVVFQSGTACAKVLTRQTLVNANSPQAYQSSICSDGSWFICWISKTPLLLAAGALAPYDLTGTTIEKEAQCNHQSGALAPAKNYDLTVTAQGNHLSFAINGQLLANIVDSRSPTGVIGLDALLDKQPGITQPATVIFRDFAYTPLPATGNDMTINAAPASAKATKNPYPPHTGTLVLNDPLHDNNLGNKWNVEKVGTESCGFVDGAYHIVAGVNQGTSCNPKAPKLILQNFTFQISLKAVQGDTLGVIFRQNQQAGTGYVFVLDVQTGALALVRFNGTNTNPQYLLFITNESTIMKIGRNQTNVLAVVANGGKLSVYLNGYMAAQITDTTYSTGQLGIFASGNQSSADVEASNAIAWQQ
jgi:hypothetical protein